jgi:DNA-binding transcriptional LysR family regulator
VELRQLEAFMAVGTELHFGHAAERLNMSPPTLSDMVRRLERELGTPLFTRTTRQVAITEAGVELMKRSKIILDDVEAARAAVRRVAGGDAGTVRIGITPPVAPTLAPHLVSAFAIEAPHVALHVKRMWLPALAEALGAGDIDVAITCGLIAEPLGTATEIFCAEPLLVGLRPCHRLAGSDTVALSDLAHDVLGVTPHSLFPAWAIAQRRALLDAGITPPTVEFDDTDLTASRWAEQPEIDWILLIPSLTHGHDHTVLRPADPQQLVPFSLQWNPNGAQTTAVARFVHTALTTDPPPGWHTQSGHLRYIAPGPQP